MSFLNVIWIFRHDNNIYGTIALKIKQFSGHITQLQYQ